MATTTNFGWETPDDTDLVKDGAAAIRTALGGVDTSFVDLKGGTTGQVLAKASNTDLDYTWVAPTAGDITGVLVTSPITGGGTSGDVTIGIASSAVVPSQTGNSGKYLTTDGTTSSWGTISAGGMTLLSTTTLSGSSTTINSITSSYKNLYFVIRGFRPNTDGSWLTLRFNSDATANRHGYLTSVGGAGAQSFDSTLGYITAATDDTVTAGLITGLIPDYANTTTWKMAHCSTLYADSGISTQYRHDEYKVMYNQTTAVSSLVFAPFSGTFNAGTVYLYGVN